jgi:hypothetical protein
MMNLAIIGSTLSLVPVFLFVYLSSHRDLEMGRFELERRSARVPGWGYRKTAIVKFSDVGTVPRSGHGYFLGPFMLCDWDEK